MVKLAVILGEMGDVVEGSAIARCLSGGVRGGVRGRWRRGVRGGCPRWVGDLREASELDGCDTRSGYESESAQAPEREQEGGVFGYYF